MRKKTIARTIQLCAFVVLGIVGLCVIAETLRSPLVVGAILVVGGGIYAVVWSSQHADWGDHGDSPK